MIPTTQKTGVVTKLEVFQYGLKIGYGFIIAYEDLSYHPILFDMLGHTLPSNQWYDLHVTNQQWLCVGNDTVQ